jgi:hypothetical protein
MRSPRFIHRFVLISCVAIGLSGAATMRLSAQEPPGDPQRAPRARAQSPRGGERMERPRHQSPADVQRLFEAYVLMQAQQALGVSDAEYPQFLARMKALLDLRRSTQQRRFALVRQLRQLTDQKGPEASEAQVTQALQALKDFETKSAADLEEATAAVDAVLDIRQQAKLRVFEEQMERRKLDLLMRARSFRGPERRGDGPGRERQQ